VPWHRQERMSYARPRHRSPRRLFTGLTAGLVSLIAAIPAILGAILILILGWIISGIVGGLVGRALRAVRVDAMADRAGIHGALRRAQMRANVSDVLAGVTKWYL